MALVGALIHFDRDARDALDQFGATVTRLGYAASKERSGLEVRTLAGKTGSCIRIDDVEASVALAIARRLAATTKKPVRVITVNVVMGKSEDDFDCALDDVELAADGTRRRGRWADDVTAEHGSDWSDLCDAKPAALAGALLTMGASHLLDVAEPVFTPHAYFASPAPIGTPRLDEIAKRVRIAERAQLTLVAGRSCVRVTDSGSTVTSFVDAAEVETLRAALGELLS